jgi:tRNA pseudouridine38-40 synthase
MARSVKGNRQIAGLDGRRNILMKLEYCGANFAGWQWQENARTVQGVLKASLEKFLQHNIKITGSGRTDAGVHALAQYANFTTQNQMTARDIKHRLNRMLPSDLVVLACRDVPWSFDARRDASWRAYRYMICERLSAINKDSAWTMERRLDISMLNKMAEIIVKSRQFENFCKTKSLKESNECLIFKAAWSRHNGFLRFDISANRYLHNMVRLLTGTMVAVCEGRISITDFADMLSLKIQNKAKYIAPACGLYLAGVGYERNNL